MKTIRGFFAILILLVLVSVNSCCSAYTYPPEFGRIAPDYDAALDAGDLHGIIEYGTRLIEIIKNEPDSDTVRSDRVSRAGEVAKAYAELGDYENSLVYYR